MNTLRPLARNTDPGTSHEAAAAIEPVRQSQCDLVYAGLMFRPGFTSAELADSMGADRYMVARRLSDLENDGRAIKGEPKVCRISGRRAVTWRVIP